MQHPPYPPYPPYRPPYPQPPYPPQKRSYFLFYVSIIALFLVVVIGVGEYLYFSNGERAPIPVTISLPTLTPQPTPDAAFISFLASFSKALASNDWTTLAGNTDQQNFSNNVQCYYLSYNYISNCQPWANFQDRMTSSVNVLAISSPVLYTCSSDYGYATHAVMGTYSLSGTSRFNGASGLATFVFTQGEQGGPWLWVNLTINTTQCKV